jgi:hypothetical protein
MRAQRAFDEARASLHGWSRNEKIKNLLCICALQPLLVFVSESCEVLRQELQAIPFDEACYWRDAMLQQLLLDVWREKGYDKSGHRLPLPVTNVGYIEESVIRRCHAISLWQQCDDKLQKLTDWAVESADRAQCEFAEAIERSMNLGPPSSHRSQSTQLKFGVREPPPVGESRGAAPEESSGIQQPYRSSGEKSQDSVAPVKVTVATPKEAPISSVAATGPGQVQIDNLISRIRNETGHGLANKEIAFLAQISERSLKRFKKGSTGAKVNAAIGRVLAMPSQEILRELGLKVPG